MPASPATDSSVSCPTSDSADAMMGEPRSRSCPNAVMTPNRSPALSETDSPPQRLTSPSMVVSPMSTPPHPQLRRMGNFTLESVEEANQESVEPQPGIQLGPSDGHVQDDSFLPATQYYAADQQGTPYLVPKETYVDGFQHQQRITERMTFTYYQDNDDNSPQQQPLGCYFPMTVCRTRRGRGFPRGRGRGSGSHSTSGISSNHRQGVITEHFQKKTTRMTTVATPVRNMTQKNMTTIPDFFRSKTHLSDVK